MAWRVRSAAWLVLGFLGLASGVLRAQAKPEPPPNVQTVQVAGETTPQPMHTLHVYMDLIQVPVLVLDSDLERLKPLEPAKFLVSLDAGPLFHPRNVRQQGDDPITLGILLDTDGEQDFMWQMSSAIASLAPGSLHPSDRVTVFGLDCSLIRTIKDAPADPAELRAGVDLALNSWLARRKNKHASPCENRVQLWDAMNLALTELGGLPGRRVMLVVTNGFDHGSRTQWLDVMDLAQTKGVAIFGYKPKLANLTDNMSGLAGTTGSTTTNGKGLRASRGAPIPTGVGAMISSMDPFGSICQSSGGMVMEANSSFVAKQLARFTAMVRERYIIEFSRPRNDAPGQHNIEVTVAKNPLYYIRSAGVTVMPSAENQSNDPTIIPRNASDAPLLGNRKASNKPPPP